ncbi:hypothetical protein [Weissella confusa]|uniref:hypothetical protein n=1 Tax=Weissella confusa TaxID=1583 RepID=UPI0013E09448|nr:hypothetical protein [Weissella confusa]QIE77719.1 hypothetical protein G4V46_08735 [Weissella confusa]
MQESQNGLKLWLSMTAVGLFTFMSTLDASIVNMALMSRLWTGFFGTGRYRTPKIFQNPDFSLKRRDFWVFL